MEDKTVDTRSVIAKFVDSRKYTAAALGAILISAGDTVFGAGVSPELKAILCCVMITAAIVMNGIEDIFKGRN